jgi:dTDP-4-dehydrorhamnose 3,5-epimerase
MHPRTDGSHSSSYQIQHPQGKLVRCIAGEVFDVIVDLRQSSKTFGKWIGVTLNSPNIQLWVPAGFAHGFYTLSDTAEIIYKVDDYYYPQYDRTLLWNSLDIVWQNDGPPVLSAKDLIGKSFEDCEKYV